MRAAPPAVDRLAATAAAARITRAAGLERATLRALPVGVRPAMRARVVEAKLAPLAAAVVKAAALRRR
jgi:hypothetical protein